MFATQLLFWLTHKFNSDQNSVVQQLLNKQLLATYIPDYVHLSFSGFSQGFCLLSGNTVKRECLHESGLAVSIFNSFHEMHTRVV